jgi:DNA-binding CsgD family transcriptional regulator
MTELDHRANLCTFSASDLSGVIRILCQLRTPAVNAQSRLAEMIREMAQLLRAEGACVYESRGPFPGVMTELHRCSWHDWQTESLSQSLNGRRLSATTQDCLHLVWHAADKDSKRDGRWHCVASCLPAGADYLLTLAFARRLQAFSTSESLLLRSLHKSGGFELITKRRVLQQRGDLSSRMGEVLAGLLDGRSEKQIASTLQLSRHTVHAYVKTLYRRYRVNSRAELLSLSIDPAAKQGIFVERM